MNQDDPLKKLIVSNSKDIDRQKMADILDPYVGFDETSQIMNFKEEFRTLGTNVDKLEMVLLADKARSLYFQDRKEGLSQSEILALEIMPEGSVKSTLKKLADPRKILKNAEGKYYIPTYRLGELFSKFKK